MRRLIQAILLIGWLLVLVGCHWINPDHETTPPLETPPDEENEWPEEKERQNVVVLGLEGFKQEVEIATYSTSWLHIDYDQTLQVVAQADKVQFYHHPEEASFEVRLIEDDGLLETEQALLQEQGYELANSFQLENGEGYIYYLYKKRHQVELYHLHHNNRSVLVRFQFVESAADQYQFIFDYMMASINLNPAESEGDAANENEK